MFKRLLVACLLLSVVTAFASPLSVDKAFVFSTKLNHQSLKLDWKIQPGYRLYRDSIAIKTLKGSQIKLKDFQLPPGLKKEDEVRGVYHAFEHELVITLPLKKQKGNLLLSVSYQGCKIKGYCYAPVMKQVKTFINQHKIIVSSTQPLQVKSFFEKTSAFWQLLVFFFLGILLAFTPCVLPMIPILSSLIVSHHKAMTTGKAFMLSLVYVLAVAVTYAIAGLVLALAGASVQAALELPWVIIVFAVIFVALGFSLFGWYEIRLPLALENKLNKITRKQKRGSYFGVAVMGVLSALIVSPCLSAPLIGALTYITNKADVWMGIFSLFLLGLGMGVPLLVVGVSTGKMLPKSGKWMDDIKTLFGFILFGLAIYMLSRILSGSVTLFLWGCLLLIASLYFLFSNIKLSGDKIPCVSPRNILLIFIFVYGVLLVVGGLTGRDEFFAPLGHRESYTNLQFERITSLTQLKDALRIAKNAKRPVLLNFSATWCAECTELKRYTFSDAKVISMLKPYKLIEADVTRNDANAVALKKRYRVVGTPTLVFFDKEGQFLPAFSLVGFVSANQLLDILGRVKHV